jgi:hypothetical protein
MNWGHYWEHTHHSIFLVFSVDMVGFADPYKVVAWRSTFSVVASVQNESFKNWRQKASVKESWNVHFHKLKEIHI